MDVSNASRMIKNVDKDECITARHNMTTATFLITKQGCEMVANKMTGTKGMLFAAEYVQLEIS